jgi:hypothetical protein
MIDHAIVLGDLVEMLKQALVQEAQQRYGIAEREVSDTRVALLTGVHRKDVRRLRATSLEVADVQTCVPVASAVVARWLSDPLYLNFDQSPRSLSRSPKSNTPGEPGFVDLVGQISKDVSARAVLDELLRLGAVEMPEKGRVSLVTGGFVPQGSVVEQFQFLAGSVGDHLAVAAHNLAPQRKEPALLEQSAFAYHLSQEQAELLHERARQLWGSAMQNFLQAATVAEERSRTAPDNHHRVRWGVYFMKQATHESAQVADAGAVNKPEGIR